MWTLVGILVWPNGHRPETQSESKKLHGTRPANYKVRSTLSIRTPDSEFPLYGSSNIRPSSTNPVYLCEVSVKSEEERHELTIPQDAYVSASIDIYPGNVQF